MKRMRGRNNNNNNNQHQHGPRRGGNPLSRSYESNGPDVKIRGTAQHIVEKYLQLGRDAQSVGDHVAAEGYFQHAEHYFRILAAAQAQNPHFNYGLNRFSEEPDDSDDEAGDGMPSAPRPEQAARPDYAARPDMDRQDRPERFERPERPDRPERPPFQPRGERDGERPYGGPGRRDRYERGPRPYQGQPQAPVGDETGGPGGAAPFPAGGEQPYPPRRERFERGPRPAFGSEDAPAGTGAAPSAGAGYPYPPRRERFERGPRPPYGGAPAAGDAPSRAPVNGDSGGLPAFLTTPVRSDVPAPAPAPAAMPAPVVEGSEDENGAGEVRRRRRGRPPRALASAADAPRDEGGHDAPAREADASPQPAGEDRAERAPQPSGIAGE